MAIRSRQNAHICHIYLSKGLWLLEVGRMLIFVIYICHRFKVCLHVTDFSPFNDAPFNDPFYY